MSDNSVAQQQFDARKRRMAEELLDEGIGVGHSTPSRHDILVEELVRARYVSVHEGIWPPYGVVIVDPTLLETYLEYTLTSITSDDSVAAFANGTDTFLVRDANDPDYRGLWSAGPTDELSLLRMSLKTGAIVVQRGANSELKIIGDDRIWLNAGYAWWSRPAARTKLTALRKALDISGRENLELLAGLLEFTFHRLSPRGIGTTLVWDVMGTGEFDDASLSDEGHPAPLAIDFRDESSLQMMTTFLNVVDGACVINSAGRLVRTQVKLNATKGALVVKPEGGTRHSSAKRFSFDHDGVVVLVVSADGPVTLYSGGVASEVLKSEYATVPLKSLDISQRVSQNFHASSAFLTCSSCNKRLVLDTVSIDGRDTEHFIECPICDAPLPGVTAFTVAARPAKPWSEAKRS